MALATRCPQCATTFKVAHDQLKMRAGMVRCGACKQVFNGIEHLVRNQADQVVVPGPTATLTAPAPRPTPVPVAAAPVISPPVVAAPVVVAPVVAAPVVAAPVVVAAAAAPSPVTVPAPPANVASSHHEAEGLGSWQNTLMPDVTLHEPDTGPETGPNPGPEEAHLSATPPSTEPMLGAATVIQSLAFADNLDAEPAPHASPAAKPQLLDQPPVAEQASVVEPEIFASVAVEPEHAHTEFDEPAQKDDGRTEPQLDKAALHVEMRAAERRQALDEAAQLELEKLDERAKSETEPDSEADEPTFVREGRRNAGVRRVMRVVLGLSSSVLLLAALGQATYAWRDQLAARLPESKPWLQRACAALGCQIQHPAQINAVAIEADELQVLPGTKGMVALSMLLNNSSSTVQSWPYLELSLNDAQDKVLARRIFTPRDYLANAQEEAQGFTARGEYPVKLYLDLTQVKASKYRVYLFYP